MNKVKNNNSYKQLSIFEVYEHNPFSNDIKAIGKGIKQHIIKRADDKILVNVNTGEVENGSSVFIQKQVVDKEKFIKLFHDNLRIFYQLKSSTFKILLYIFEVLIMNKDHIYFSINDCIEKTHIKSRATITSALSDLIENKIIARTKDHYKYFINPTIFFNGNRVMFAKMLETNEDKYLSNDNDNNIISANELETSETDTNN